MVGANLRTITAPPRFVISSDSSHHSGANIAEAEVDSFTRPSVPLMTMATTITSTVDPTTTIKERLVNASIFGGGSSFGTEHTVTEHLMARSGTDLKMAKLLSFKLYVFM
ncbi:hypothetical protein Tco_0783617 [Tanacetum coccineum]